MAYAFVAKNDTAATASTTTITQSVTYSAGDYVFIRASCANSAATATCTDGTNTYTAATGSPVTDTNGPQKYFDFWCKAPAAGTFTIQITFNATSSFRSVAYWRYSGLDNTANAVSAGQYQVSPGTGTDAVTSTTATPASQPAIVFGVVADYTSASNPVYTAGTGFTTQGPMTNTDAAFGAKSGSEDKRVTSTSAVAATFTASLAVSHNVARVWIVPEASSGVSGTSATTNANDTSAASGTTTVKGSSATTNANDTSSASGTTTVKGSSATANADDTATASGSVGAAVTGTVAVTNANDTSSATGTTKILGVSGTTNANDTAAASGTTRIVGVSATTNANDTVSASGQAGAVTGTAACVNANDVCNAAGTTPNTRSQLGGLGRAATDAEWRDFAEYKDALRQARKELEKAKPSVAKVEKAIEALVTPVFDVPSIEVRIDDFRALEGIEDLSEKFQRVVHDFLLMLEDEDDVELLLH